MSDPGLQHPKFDFVAANASLDFANTLGGLRGGKTNEHLSGYAGLVTWAFQAGLLDRDTALALQRAAEEKPSVAGRAFARALAGREAIYGVFSAVAAGREAPPPLLELINSELPHALGRMRVKPTKQGFAWALAPGDEALDLPLWAVMRETAELLVSNQLPLVRECSGDACSWLFLDSTRNHSRLWCSMSGCGNRAKVRRHRKLHQH
jgi:predicted RNA-binding Zn ribbon-like protein